MRADRLLSIMLLLQAHRRLTAGELARRLLVSERTIYRDLDALSSSGVPVVAERGTGGGCYLVDGYQTRLTGMSEAEIQALFLTQPTRLLADLGLAQASEGALLKLFATLPSFRQRDAEYMRQRILIDTSGWRRPSDNVTFLPVLQEAVWEERKVRLAYRRGDAADVERIVDPLGLVAKGSIWYLVAAVDGEPRAYRVSRVQHAELTDQSAERPPDFDLAAFWQTSTAEFTNRLPSYIVKLRVAPGFVDNLRLYGRYAQVVEIEPPAPDDSWQNITMRFEFEEDARDFVLGSGDSAQILEPLALRQKVIDAARRVLAFYENIKN
jgi:predicted DNA-binding transcriptional regulator YafY